MIIKKCKKCKKEFKSYPCRKRIFCGMYCSNISKPQTFKKGHVWVGKLKNNGKNKHSSGYIEIYSPNHPFKSVRNSVLEHRLVMEKYLKRYLLPTEVVHHKNGIKTDNRLKNLELFQSQSEHIKNEYKNSKSFRDSLIKNQFRKQL